MDGIALGNHRSPPPPYPSAVGLQPGHLCFGLRPRDTLTGRGNRYSRVHGRRPRLRHQRTQKRNLDPNRAMSDWTRALGSS